MEDFKFYNREQTVSSTSKYIQVNKNTETDSFAADTPVLNATPSDKIIWPQLKDDTNKTILFTATAASMVASYLTPNTKQVQINETRPTDNLALYGYIQVKENKAGFVVINDETPGNVRQIDLHPTGTYTALIDNGDYHTKVTNDRQEITDGNWYIKTSKDKVEIIAGTNKIEIRTDQFINIAGKSNYNLEGTQNNSVGGNVTNHFHSNYSGRIANNYVESVGSDKTENTGGNLLEIINGDHTEKTVGALTIHVIGNINITSTQSTTIIAKDIIIEKAKKIYLN